MRLLLALVPLLLLVPNASASGSAGCHIGNDALALLADSCSVTVPSTSSILVTVTVWQHTTGIVHIDAVNGAPGGDRIEFECYLVAVTDPCVPLVETGGFIDGSWTITATVGDANAAWVVFENADIDVHVDYA